MSDETNEPSVQEQRVNAAIAAYLEAMDAGKAPDPKEFIAAHSDIAADLEGFFANRDDFERMAEPLWPAGATAPKAQADDVTLPPAGDRTEAATLGPTETAGAAIGTLVRYFGDYELLEEIARGGMGVVYKARQVSLNRIVALKMILAGQLASEDDVKRFHTEAEAAANLDHPGIVPIYEVGQHQGQHYFSMGFVEGSSLAAKVADGPLPPRKAAEYTKKVAQAVAYAHEYGVIHRDLKPANVLLDKKGEPKVTDFGLAKKVEGDSGLTATGQILGTPGYMPPEQASGKIGEVMETADVYSLGAILYCLLTARPPFQADNPLDTLMQVLEREPVSPRQLNPKVPKDLETIALKCLEKDARRRYGSAQGLADELQRFLNGEPIVARPVSRVERGWRWCKRQPVVASLSATVVLALVAGTVISSLFALEARRRAEGEAMERHKAEGQTRIATEQRTIADQQRDIARLNGYCSDMLLASRAWHTKEIGRLEELLARHEPKPGTPDLRSWEWYYLRNLGRSTLTLRGTGWVTWSPDGRRLAVTDGESKVVVYDSIIGKQQFTLQAWGVRWSPDGNRWALRGDNNTVQLYDPASRKVTCTLSGHRKWVSSMRWSRDGSRLATSSGDGTVKVWDTVKGQEMVTFRAHDGEARDVAWSPDGRQLASTGTDSTIKIWDLATAKQLRVFPHAATWAVAWSPDGQRVAGQGDGRTVRILDAENGAERLALAGHKGGASPSRGILTANCWQQELRMD